MKNQLPIVARVEGLGEVVQVNNDFYVELQQLKDSGAVLISPRDEAYVRLQTLGKENIGVMGGTRTSAGFEYVRGQLPIFRVRSRLNNLQLAKLAVKANGVREYFHTNSIKEYEDSLKQAEKDKNKDPIKRNVVVLPSRDPVIVSDKENWEILEAALKDQAKPYFEYNGPIIVYPICKDEVDNQIGTILNVLWFRDFEGTSIFYGFSRNLNHDDRARGIIVNRSTTRDSKDLAYKRRINQHLKLIEQVKSGEVPLSKLERVAKFLKGLSQDR